MYGNSLLCINLTDGRIETRSTCDDYKRKYLGGVGFLAKALYEGIEKNSDPYGEKNILGIAAGPLTGETPFSGRFVLASKSPLTQGWGESHIGGRFGIAIKSLGYDAVLVAGRADRPVDIHIGNDVEICDSSYWGKSVFMTLRQISEEGHYSALVIGSAGENLVRYASIAASPYNFAGRSGLGAVMGSKNVKAIVAEHGKPLHFLADSVGKMRKLERQGLKKYGTSHLADVYNSLSILPAKNSRLNKFEEWGDLELERYLIRNKNADRGCPLCPTNCKKIVNTKSGSVKMPEYESLAGFGPNLLISDIGKISEISELCDDLGLDAISTSRVLSYLCEVRERKLQLPEHLQDVHMQWGNAASVREAVMSIASRAKGYKLLGEGVKKLSETIPGSSSFALHVGGLEVPPGSDPRCQPSVAESLLKSPRGADHLYSLVIYDAGREDFDRQKMQQHVEFSKFILTICDCLVLCKSSFLHFLENDLETLTADLLSESLGYSVDLREIHRNVDDLRNKFNSREGVEKRELPDRFVTEKL